MYNVLFFFLANMQLKRNAMYKVDEEHKSLFLKSV